MSLTKASPGLKAAAAPAKMDPEEGGCTMQVSSNITLDDNGIYRWRYEVSLYRNPVYFFLIWKIFFFIILGIFALIVVLDLIDWETVNLPDNLKLFGYFVLGMTVLTGIGYLIYALIMGGKYIVDFEMDERGIKHSQSADQAKKAKKIGKFAAAAGALSGRPSAAGAGLNAQRTEMYSDFQKVRSIKAYPRRHLIKVNGALQHNQVYAADQDFEFVRSYIASRCPNLK